MQTTRRSGGISCGIILVLLLSFSQLSYSQKKKYDFLPENNARLWYTWGLPHFEEDNASYETAKKYNFNYYRVGGCTMDPAFAEYCKKHNKKLDRKITKELGADWKETSNQEFLRLYKLFRFADTLLMQDSSFWNKQVEVMIRYTGAEYEKIIKGSVVIGGMLSGGNDWGLKYFRETNKDSVILVMICSERKWMTNSELHVFEQFEFNLITKKWLAIAVKPEDAITSAIK